MKLPLNSLVKATLPALAGALVLTASPDAHATLLIQQDFNISGSALPTGWMTPADSTAQVGIDNIPDGGRGLRISRGAGGTANAVQVAYYQGSGVDGSLTDGALSNFNASVLMNTGNLLTARTTSSLGVTVNASTTAYNGGANSYYIGFLPAGNGAPGTEWEAGFGIWKGQANHIANQNGAVAFDGITALTSNIDVLMQISYIDTNLSASIWTVDSNGDALAEIASVSITDAVLPTGHLGLRAAYGNTGGNVYFKSVEVSAIPEPSTGLLILSSAAFLAYRKRRTASKI